MTMTRFLAAMVLTTPLAAGVVAAQGTAIDYSRADQLNARYDGLAVNTPDRPTWIGRSPRLWYRRTVKGGYEFIVVDVAAKTKQPAFDHTKLAAAIIRAGLSEVPAAGRGGGRRGTGNADARFGDEPPVRRLQLRRRRARDRVRRDGLQLEVHDHRLRLPACRTRQRSVDEAAAAAGAEPDRSPTTNRATWCRSKARGTTSRRSATR